jgi:endonuclease-3
MKNIGIIIRLLRKEYGSSYLNSLPENPFRVLITTVLSQRNRDEMTDKAAKKLFKKYNTARKLSEADTKEIEKLIKQSGFYKTKAKRIKEISRILIKEHSGKVPDELESLLKLPGVGRKTANCVLVYAYRKPAIPVDTHVHKISNRIGWVKTKTPEQTENALIKIVPKKYWLDVNNLLVMHGQKTCRQISPKCPVCRINKYCKKIGVNPR